MFVYKSVPVSCGLLVNYSGYRLLWVEPLTISTLVVFVDKFLVSIDHNLCRYQGSCVVVLWLLSYMSEVNPSHLVS